MQVALADKVPFVSKPRRTSDGYLVADVRAGRTGIQLYSGFEVDRAGMDTVRVYRPPEEVFDDAAMASFTSVPVTIDHPPEMVTPDNWRKYARGFTGESIREDGGKFIRVPLILKDAAAINAVESGDKKELSFGYFCDLEFKSGVTPDGEKYDAIQRGLRGNHLAIVSVGRAGGDCRIGDGRGEVTMDLSKVMVDGIPVETTPNGALVIDTLKQRVEKANHDNLKLVSDHVKALSDKDAEIKTLTDALAAEKKNVTDRDTQIVDLKKQSDPLVIDKLVADRATVISQARSIASDGDYAGKSVADVRRLAVARIKGAEAVKDKSDDYVQALFDTCLAGVGGGGSDPIADFMRQGAPAAGGGGSEVDRAWGGMVDNLTTAWKNPSAGTGKTN